MRNFLKLAVCSLAPILLVSSAKSAQTTVAFDSGNEALYSNPALTNLLTAGNPTTAGDGAVLQLGYYSTATVGSPFSGTFIPLSGATSANTTFATTSIGDDSTQGAGDGTYALTLTFVLGSTTTGNNLPAAGTPLSIRFFNATTLSASTLDNAVSDSSVASWRWQTPQDGAAAPSLAISLDNPGLVWLGGPSTAFYTALPVPEPSVIIFALVGFGGLVWPAKRGALSTKAHI